MEIEPPEWSAPVVWQYGPLVKAGWATEREFVPHARRTAMFLIATEGSSDVHILKHALALLRPGIVDFFRFIDVSASHPFSGTGNLVKFAEGRTVTKKRSRTIPTWFSICPFSQPDAGVQATGSTR